MEITKIKDIHTDTQLIDSIVSRVHYLINQMIYMANHRTDKEKGDPKVGGHSSGSTSTLHIMGALHLFCKTGFDHIVNKPHASPTDHAYNYLLDLLLNLDLSKLSLEEANKAMESLRAFPQNNEYVFQSYHSPYDPDHHNFLPSGTVGIPPVQAGYLAHAYRYAARHGYEVPPAHFWAVMGDAEFREGSLFEAIPDFAERELGNLTWMIDYNRQSLDGHRITHHAIMRGSDDTRIQKTMEANGWDVIQVRHGHFRQSLFAKEQGCEFKKWLEEELEDYELQSILLVDSPQKVKDHVKRKFKHLNDFLESVSDEDFKKAMHDLGGHDIENLVDAMEKSKANPNKPCLIIAHTIKGWGLQMAATSGNHSSLPNKEEMDQLRKTQGLTNLFERFSDSSREGKFLKKRSEQLFDEITQQHEIRSRNQKKFLSQATQFGNIPETLGINLKMASYPHTQWMLGQLTAKLTRIANTPLDNSQLAEKQKPLNNFEKAWKFSGELIVSMAPDVGTSTNLNPTMDGKVFGAAVTDDIETELNVKDKKVPDLIPSENHSHRFIRFDIAEANVMSCMGSYGKLRDILGIPILPLMTVYDFFVKRALDQYFYDLYWKSSFILVGTPSGVTLSPEGAQHGWKSDIQIPNQIIWEPFYCQELDWILAESIRRHIMNDNEGRSGVYIRGVTRGVEQKDLLKLLRTQRKYKSDPPNTLMSHKATPVDGAIDESQVPPLSDKDIMDGLKTQVLSGAYELINYEGYVDYEPGDNVVQIFAMGSLGTEAIKASEELVKRGIYANVIIVTSPDLLVGNLGAQNDFYHLKVGLNINANLYLQPQLNGALEASEVSTFSGRRVPLVSVHDGEPGLLDNIGSIIGVKQKALAVRKHSRCGRPKDIYKYHGIDSHAIVEACGKVLSETALEPVTLNKECPARPCSEALSKPNTLDRTLASA